MPATLSRTSSTTSSHVSSDDLYATFIAESLDSSSRRTRKRFTNAQLTMLEQLYHQNSHPSRMQRELVAQAAAMEVKSVTIWLQNRRQTDRRSILASGRVPPTVMINSSRATYQRVSSPSTASSTSTTSSRRPSLDSVASRSEQRDPRTPSRHRQPHAALWESMPSSPLQPPSSPPNTDFVEFGREKRTRSLEWACEHRRMVGKAEREARRANPGMVPDEDSTDNDNDNEPIEAVTPPSTWGEGDPRWTESKKRRDTHSTNKNKLPTIQEPDDETMKAALALCGLMGSMA
ncbi:Homeobox domain-containing protein [Mycena chlorophos]|uniref:Homeobox domain-containing protein n=1 Tax=Mycena chlorophos TaxID=658473 RepID=A0A8H6WIS1_MYCCL|nr:Homeobox domain-containing protein [Mycena chlorophos]